MPKSLVIVATTDLSSDQRLQRAALALHDAGWQVTLLGRLLPGSPALPERPFRQVRLRCPVYKGPVFYLLFNLMAAIWLLFKRSNVITAADADTLPGTWLAARLSGSHLVFDAHEYYSQVPEVVRRPRIQRIWRWIETYLISKVDAAYTVGPALAEVFTHLYGVSFATVRNVPIKGDYAFAQSLLIPNRILYTGALNEGRGLDELLAALTQLPHHTTVICGDGPLAGHLHQKAQMLGVQAQVEFTGRLSPAELRRQVAQAWLGFSLLEPIGESYRLSLANKFFDYIHAGLPQICPALPEYEAILQKHPVALGLPCTVDAIVQAVKHLQDQQIYASLKAACPSAADTFNWEHESKRLVDIYKPFAN